MLEPSPRLKKEASRLGCEPNHIILADLVLSGYTNAEAYDIAYSENAMLDVQKRINAREKAFASEGYKRAYEEKMLTRKYTTENATEREKTDIIKELNTLVNQAGTDVKMKADLLMKIADLQQMKKGQQAEQDDPVSFFLSLSCNKCPLLQSLNEFITKRNELLPPEEHNRPVRPDEMQRIVEMAEKEIMEKREL